MVITAGLAKVTKPENPSQRCQAPSTPHAVAVETAVPPKYHVKTHPHTPI
jgi:hypothetical protein